MSVNFQENAIYDFNKYIFSTMSGRVLWPWSAKPKLRTAWTIGAQSAHTTGNPEWGVLAWSSPTGSGPVSLSLLGPCPPLCIHISLKPSTKAATFLAHICAFGWWEHQRKSNFWKTAQTSKEKKRRQQMCPHLLPDCYSRPFRPWGIPWSFLLFQRLGTNVHLQPLVTGLRRDL